MIGHACPKAFFHVGARGLRIEILSKKGYKGVVWPIHRLKKKIKLLKNNVLCMNLPRCVRGVALTEILEKKISQKNRYGWIKRAKQKSWIRLIGEEIHIPSSLFMERDLFFIDLIDCMSLFDSTLKYCGEITK